MLQDHLQKGPPVLPHVMCLVYLVGSDTLKNALGAVFTSPTGLWNLLVLTIIKFVLLCVWSVELLKTMSADSTCK